MLIRSFINFYVLFMFSCNLLGFLNSLRFLFLSNFCIFVQRIKLLLLFLLFFLVVGKYVLHSFFIFVDVRDNQKYTEYQCTFIFLLYIHFSQEIYGQGNVKGITD